MTDGDRARIFNFQFLSISNVYMVYVGVYQPSNVNDVKNITRFIATVIYNCKKCGTEYVYSIDRWTKWSKKSSTFLNVLKNMAPHEYNTGQGCAGNQLQTALSRNVARSWYEDQENIVVPQTVCENNSCKRVWPTRNFKLIGSRYAIIATYDFNYANAFITFRLRKKSTFFSKSKRFKLFEWTI